MAGYAQTRTLLAAGIDVVRLNMSHGDHPLHDTTYLDIRTAAAGLGRDAGIMVNLQGPKIRLGRFSSTGPIIWPSATGSRSPSGMRRALARSAPPPSPVCPGMPVSETRC
ncbi:pyruvate kinase [Kocuria arenosa]|uniref:pyruvate kinase n=1 Tax=Kocuria arenosa TaxID=3071446 RepID=UPI0034D50842